MKKTIPFSKKPETQDEWALYWAWSKARKFLFEVYREDRLLCCISADNEIQALEVTNLLRPEATRIRMDHWGKHHWIENVLV